MNLQLIFSLPEEEKEAELAVYSRDLFNVINDYNNWLRQMNKSDIEIDAEKAKQQLWKSIEDNDILHLFND